MFDIIQIFSPFSKWYYNVWDRDFFVLQGSVWALHSANETHKWEGEHQSLEQAMGGGGLFKKQHNV